MLKLRPFQRKFVAGVLCAWDPPSSFVGCEGQRQESWLAAWLVADSLTPGGQLFEAGAENILLSGSVRSSAICLQIRKGSSRHQELQLHRLHQQDRHPAQGYGHAAAGAIFEGAWRVRHRGR